ncbi:MAG: FAD binding domain-containing protein [Nitrososphaerales archaeon]
MPVFKPAEWVAPKTLEEAVDILQKRKARVIAGGTGIYELAKRGMLPEADVLVDLQSLNLEYVKIEGNALKIGAMSRFTWLLKQAVFQRPELGGLLDSIKNVKPVQVRNVATAGGAISISLPFLDFGPSTLAFDASVLLVGAGGKQRVLSVEKFFLDYLLPDLRKGEILTEIQIPIIPASGSAFAKLGRTSGDFALVNVCARLSFDKGGKCADSRISLGGIANTPVRSKKAESQLKGEKLTKAVVAKAAESASAEFEPTPSVHGSPWYKKEISKTLTRDAVYTAAQRAGFVVESN